MDDLARIQRRFYDLVTSGEGVVEPGLFTGPPRLEVYAEMYLARLHDALAVDYPKLRFALGDESFRDLVASYVRARPPTSFTLRNAGDALPGFLDARDGLAPWAADLARLERARIEVYDGSDAPVLALGDLASLPAEQFPSLRVGWVPSSTIVTLGWSADALWSLIEDGAQIVDPRTRDA